MDIRVKTLIIFLVLLFIVNSWYITQIFQEMFAFKWITKKLRLRLCLIWRTLSSTYFFISLLAFFKYWFGICDNHRWVLKFPTFLTHVVKIYLYFKITSQHFNPVIYLLCTLLCLHMILSFQVFSILGSNSRVNKSLSYRSFYELVYDFIDRLGYEKIKRKEILLLQIHLHW